MVLVGCDWFRRVLRPCFVPSGGLSLPDQPEVAPFRDTSEVVAPVLLAISPRAELARFQALDVAGYARGDAPGMSGGFTRRMRGRRTCVWRFLRLRWRRRA